MILGITGFFRLSRILRINLYHTVLKVFKIIVRLFGFFLIEAECDIFWKQNFTTGICPFLLHRNC